MKKLSILGSTGSVGTQTLDIIRKYHESYSVAALTCGHNIELFRRQLIEFHPLYACTAEEQDALLLKKEFPHIEIGYGMEGLCRAASISDADMTVNSLLGMMGLRPTYAAISAHKDIAFANKETLVTGGEFIMREVKKSSVKFLPVDSEHSAIFQCLQGASGNPVKKIILTASGGPFRSYTYDQLRTVTKQQALKHPNWIMGAKITIDSASMMNKGLEIIEASRLFDIPADSIEVVVHPESVIHSAIEFEDGSILAQMGIADMKIPIAYALSYPERLKGVCKSLDLFQLGTIHFEKPDLNTFRCLRLAYDAISEGGSCTAVLNAANEEAVKAFLDDRISFTAIADCVEYALNRHIRTDITSIDDIFEIEKQSRRFVLDYIGG